MYSDKRILQEDTLQQFEDVVPEADWARGIKVWSQFSDYPHHVSSTPVASWPQKVNASVDSANETNREITDDGTTKENEATGVGDAACLDVLKKPTIIQSGAGEGATEMKKAGTDSDVQRELSFRATCYRSGAKHVFESPQAARSFGGALNDYFNWKVDLTNFDIEAVLTIENRHVYVAIALTKQSLHRRNIVEFGPTTLRPTIAYAMLR